MKKKLACLLLGILSLFCMALPAQAKTTSNTSSSDVSYISSGASYIEAYSPGTNFANQVSTGDMTRCGTYLLVFLGASLVIVMLILIKRHKDDFKITDLT